jgi:hypothetical protein
MVGYLLGGAGVVLLIGAAIYYSNKSTNANGASIQPVPPAIAPLPIAQQLASTALQAAGLPSNPAGLVAALGSTAGTLAGSLISSATSTSDPVANTNALSTTTYTTIDNETTAYQSDPGFAATSDLND